MRKFIFTLFSLCFAFSVMAESVKIGDLYYNLNSSNNTAEVTCQYFYTLDNYSGLSSVVIPESINYDGTTYSVTSIGQEAFQSCSSLTSITIPNSVTRIGHNAFLYCSSLASITIPNSVTSIGDGAFGLCVFVKDNFINNSSCDDPYANNWGARIGDKEIDGLVLKDDTILVGGRAFLTSIVIPNSVTRIEKSAFYQCVNLISVTIPNSVTNIGDGAFNRCFNLTSVVIGSNVVTIGDNAFSECSSLGDIIIPESVTTIGKDAFYYSKLYNDETNWDNNVLYISNCLIDTRWQYLQGSYVIRDSTRLIANMAFSGCDKITSVTLPNSVRHIGKYAFRYCSSLVALNIPEGVKIINDYTFQQCYSLENITFPESITYLGEYCGIEDTKWYKNQKDGVLYIGCLLYKYKGEMPANTSIEIKDGIICISSRAFYNCSSLASITIPNSVKSIGDEAFYNCESLTKTNYTGDIASWCNLKFSTYTSNPISYSSNFYINNQEVKDLVIPSTIDSIYDYAFCGCSSLTSITIPNSVTSIGEYAFRSCSSLTSITIPNSVTSIGDWAFCYCRGLTSITIPESVTIIGNGTFGGCMSLASFTIPNSVVHIGEQAFENCSSITSITIGNGVKSIDVRAFAGCSAITKVNYTGDIADWCKIQFAASSASPFQLKESYNNYYSITKFYLNEQPFDGIFPNNVDRINAYAFARASFDNEHYNSITIGDNVKYIGDGAFSGCTDLEDVYLPTTPPKLGENVFEVRNNQYDYDGIDYFYIPCGLKKIYNASDFGVNKGYTGFVSYTKLMYSGYCGDSLNLSWSYSAEKLTITGTGEYHPYGCTPWELLIDSIKTLEIGQGITKISDYAFDDLINLNTLILPNSIEKIGAKAFNTCKKLYDIYCYAQFPPETSNNTFVNYNAFLHVPCDYQRYYTADMVFSKFTNVECISAETISTDSIIVSPSFNDVVFTWPTESNAGSYTLTINKDGEVFCTLTFNATGQLTGIAFAPSRDGQRHAPAATQAANGFTFTVTGLEEGTDYSYNLVIKDNSGKTLQTYSGEFRTQSTSDRTVTVEYDATQGQVTGAGVYQVGDTVTLTAIPNDGYRFVRWSNEVEDNPYTFVILDNVTLSAEFEAVIHSDVENATQSQQSDTHKLLRDGQLLILRDGKTYNIMGAEVK